MLAMLHLEPTDDTLFLESTLQLPKLLHSIALLSKSDSYVQSHQDQLDEHHGVYFFKDKIYVPNASSLRTQVIQVHHDTLYSGHMGINHTLAALQRWFYWPHMHRDVTMSRTVSPACKPSLAKPSGKVYFIPSTSLTDHGGPSPLTLSLVYHLLKMVVMLF
jgi:hypothetical protein